MGEEKRSVLIFGHVGLEKTIEEKKE